MCKIGSPASLHCLKFEPATFPSLRCYDYDNDDDSSSSRRAKAERTWDSTAMATARPGPTVRLQLLKEQDKRASSVSVASRRRSRD